MKAHILGMEIDNPVVILSGPWSRGKEYLKKSLMSGAGAVFTETITGESYSDLSPRYEYCVATGGLQNIRLYSGMSLEDWIDDLNEIDEEGRYGQKTKLIASVMGSTPSEIAYVAKKVEKTGVDGIELGLACPMGEGPAVVAGDPQLVYEYVKAACSEVSLPISVKLSSSCANLPLVVKACIKGGAAGITAIDTVRGILSIDIKSATAGLPTYGGYSGTPIRPIGLSTVAGIAQTCSLPILGAGGIDDGENVIEYIMAGASAGGMGTRILLDGYEAVGRAIDEIETWADENGVRDISEIRGKALSSLRSFEELKVESKVAVVKKECTDKNCSKCSDCCLDEAISFDDGIRIDRNKCTGCGLCISICPDDKLELEWK